MKSIVRVLQSLALSFLVFNAMGQTEEAKALKENFSGQPDINDKARGILKNYINFANANSPRPQEDNQKYNIVKLNLTSAIFKNFSVQYERILNKKFSASLHVNLMPQTSLPLKGLLLNEAGNDENAKKAIEDFRLSNFSLTPEFRIYFGKNGFGRGFYLAPFYRYATFKTSNLPISFQTDNGNDNKITLGGNITAHTGGLLIGAQWFLGNKKNIVLDWSILGPHYGSGSGAFTGVTSETLSESEQEDIKRTVDNIEIPLIEKTITTSSNGAVLSLDGPWGGVRAGLSLGIRF